MRSTLARRQRSVPLAFALIIAVIAAIFTVTTQREPAHAGVLGHDHLAGPVGLPTAARVAFHDQMRKLWEDHVTSFMQNVGVVNDHVHGCFRATD